MGYPFQRGNCATISFETVNAGAIGEPRPDFAGCYFGKAAGRTLILAGHGPFGCWPFTPAGFSPGRSRKMAKTSLRPSYSSAKVEGAAIRFLSFASSMEHCLATLVDATNFSILSIRTASTGFNASRALRVPRLRPGVIETRLEP